MKLLGVLLFLAVCLGVQAGLGAVWPEAHRYLDLMALPVIRSAVHGSQRSGMLTGCASGLIQDAWFQIGTFGLNGFKKTLLGWLLGGLSSRFDLNHAPGRLALGASFSLLDSGLDLGLRYMLDQPPGGGGLGIVLVRALVLGFTVATVFGWIDRYRRYREMRRLA